MTRRAGKPWSAAPAILAGKNVPVFWGFPRSDLGDDIGGVVDRDIDGDVYLGLRENLTGAHLLFCILHECAHLALDHEPIKAPPGQVPPASLRREDNPFVRRREEATDMLATSWFHEACELVGVKTVEERPDIALLNLIEAHRQRPG